MAQAADSGREPSTRLSRVAIKWAYCHISMWMISDVITAEAGNCVYEAKYVFV